MASKVSANARQHFLSFETLMIYHGSIMNVLWLMAMISIQNDLFTVTSPSTAIARVATWPVWVHVVLTSLCWIVIPGQEVLEYGAWVIKILCPSTPVTDLPK